MKRDKLLISIFSSKQTLEIVDRNRKMTHTKKISVLQKNRDDNFSYYFLLLFSSLSYSYHHFSLDDRKQGSNRKTRHQNHHHE